MKTRILLVLTLFLAVTIAKAQEHTPAQLAQIQLDGYNAGDIELFLSAYSDTVKIYNFPDQLTMSGKDKMRQSYGGMFERAPDLHCTLTNRMVLGNKVIDQEYVVFSKERPPTQVIAIYTIEGGKIAQVHFLRPKLD